MISYEIAKNIAAQHLQKSPPPHPEYRWKEVDGVKCENGWLFEYIFEPINGGIAGDDVAFGGAPAFIVFSQSGEVRDVGWDKYTSLSK